MRLAGQRAAAAIGNRDRNHQGQRRTPVSSKTSRMADDRRLCVQRVENGLEQQEIDAAVDQAAHVILVGAAHLIERHRAERRVADVGRNRQRPVGRPDRARNEARPIRRLAASIHRPPRAQGARPRRSARRRATQGRSRTARSPSREGVRLDDVGARGEIGAVDLADHVGPRQDQQVVVALQIVA